jgi:hypothetical protein
MCKLWCQKIPEASLVGGCPSHTWMDSPSRNPESQLRLKEHLEEMLMKSWLPQACTKHIEHIEHGDANTSSNNISGDEFGT